MEKSLDFKPIRITRTSTEIITQIIRMIHTNQLSEGDRLPSESELARALETSRPTVREALSALKALGLVETVTGSGTYIKKETQSQGFLSRLSVEVKTQQDFLEALEARRAIESEICQLAALRAKNADLKKIHSALESLNKANTPEDFRKADYHFHMSLAYASQNKLFVKFIEDVYQTLTVYYWQILEQAGRTGESISRSKGEHIEIYEAVVSKNPKSARESMIRHLEKIKMNFLDTFRAK
jgi:GntR family transcriptional repressor for pyruvate dehydrogenase complex